MNAKYVLKLPVRKRQANVGGKALKLSYLLRRGLQVPATWVCTQDAYQRYATGDMTVLDRVREELRATLDSDKHYAVRSSANLEDGSDATFAGQFTTELDVRSLNDVIDAVRSVWDGVRSPGVLAYLEANGTHVQAVKMAVVIQEMVAPEVSGVSFSVNPVTGMDEVLVEAVPGSGEALVQQGVTPQRWVNKWGGWIQQPEDACVPLNVVQQVVLQTRHIAARYGHPVDLEWVYDGQTVHWVQLREVTALDIPLYSNHISREVFPGLIKPLVWSVNVPLVNGAWVDLFTALIGPNEIDANSLARSFFYRAYFNMGAIGRIFELLGFPRESLELLMGLEVGGPDKPSFKPSARTYALLPRMLWFVVTKLRFASQVECHLSLAQPTYEEMRGAPLDDLSEEQILAHIKRLYQQVQETAYYNILTPLLMQVYNRMLDAGLRRAGVDAQTVDVVADLEAYRRYEPHAHLAALRERYLALDEDTQDRLRRGGYDALNDLAGARAFREGIEAFMAQFGHLSDSGNDFSAIPWRENPGLVLSMAIDHQRQDKPRSGARFADLPLSFFSRLLLTPIYRRARRFRLLREAIGSTYTFGYGLFRDAFLALGMRAVARGIIDEREDVLYLTWDQVKQMVTGGDKADGYRGIISARKRDMEACRDIVVPGVIYGDEAKPVSVGSLDRLSGTPTSRGRYTGPARVVHGVAELNRVRSGDVLVVPYSDVGWTPLFARASAVVAESGGILSHSSIIAREFGIPAVVAVQGACLLPDDTVVTVDGYNGEVIVHRQGMTTRSSFERSRRK